MLGSGAGTLSYPDAAKEMVKWVHRSLATIEEWWVDRDFGYLRDQERGEGPTIAEIVLYQFFEFTKDCFGVDMTLGSGQTKKDAYGGEVVEEYEKLKEFAQAFGMGESSKRDEENGEVASKAVLEQMHTWAEGVW